MILAILQARMNTQRLPGKSLASLHGEPLIYRQLQRIAWAGRVDRTIVATSNETCDDPLAAFLLSRGRAVFRGAPRDLLDRFLRCAQGAGSPSHIVRLKGDAAFIDPGVIDAAVAMALVSGADYVSNRTPVSFPRGLEVEVVRMNALQAVAEEPRTVGEPISPTALIRSNPDRFSRARLTAARDLSSLDWRIKTAADLAFARAVYGALHEVEPAFHMDAVLNLVGSRQDLRRFNAAA